MKIVINTCYGGFNLSDTGVRAYAARKGLTLYVEKGDFGFDTYWTVPEDKRIRVPTSSAWYDLSAEERIALNKAYSEQTLYSRDIDRNDPDLVAVVEELGSIADGDCAKLHVVEIPDGIDWDIDEYDGREHIEEKHRTWA